MAYFTINIHFFKIPLKLSNTGRLFFTVTINSELVNILFVFCWGFFQHVIYTYLALFIGDSKCKNFLKEFGRITFSEVLNDLSVQMNELSIVCQSHLNEQFLNSYIYVEWERSNSGPVAQGEPEVAYCDDRLTQSRSHIVASRTDHFLLALLFANRKRTSSLHTGTQISRDQNQPSHPCIWYLEVTLFNFVKQIKGLLCCRFKDHF